MYNVPKFLKRENESLIFNDDGVLIYYIPEVLFERDYVTVIGEVVELMGLFIYELFDKNGKKVLTKNFNYPTVFCCKPHEIEKVKNFKLDKEEPGDYRLLKFVKGDAAVLSVRTAQDVENAENFYKIFTTGKLPTTIPYNEIQNYFIQNIRLNGANYGLSAQMLGVLISEQCRDPKDIRKLFRHTDMKDMTNYVCLNINQNPKLVSPFTSVTSVNWDEAVVNAVVNKNHKYSPLEKIFTL